METWEINGHTLEFDEDKHCYLCDGVITPSVTQILQIKFPNEFQFVSESVLQEAARKGTELHEAIEAYEKTGQKSELKEFRNYLFLKKHFGFENIANEQPVIYAENGKVLFVGRLDQVIKMCGKIGINDFKRVSAPNKEKIAYQLNLYRLAYQQCYGTPIEFLTFTHLRNDTRRFTQLPINEEKAKELIKEYWKGAQNND